ncbi:MAG: hypothetical protein C4530_08025 [Desulfobacteraceae bacterium]|nr:MAG: hypothetical protein C4530_08025 [Desulfobacteraceae bacterium]
MSPKYAPSPPEGGAATTGSKATKRRIKEELSTSKFIFEVAVELWIKSKNMESQTRRYEEGYRNMPDSPQGIQARKDTDLRGCMEL